VQLGGTTQEKVTGRGVIQGKMGGLKPASPSKTGGVRPAERNASYAAPPRKALGRDRKEFRKAGGFGSERTPVGGSGQGEDGIRGNIPTRTSRDRRTVGRGEKDAFLNSPSRCKW